MVLEVESAKNFFFMSNVFILLLLRGIQYSAKQSLAEIQYKISGNHSDPWVQFVQSCRAVHCIANGQFGAEVRVRGKCVE